jgi:hypothetical protein
MANTTPMRILAHEKARRKRFGFPRAFGRIQ